MELETAETSFDETNTADAGLLIAPTGYHVLIRLEPAPEKTKGGIIKPESAQKLETVASMVGQVVSYGPEAYADRERYPAGPWCLPGDWVLFRSYAGTRFLSGGAEYRLINDDSVEAVTLRPDLIEKA